MNASCRLTEFSIHWTNDWLTVFAEIVNDNDYDGLCVIWQFVTLQQVNISHSLTLSRFVSFMSDKNRQHSKHVACNLKGNEMAIAIVRLALTCIFCLHALFRIPNAPPDGNVSKYETGHFHHISNRSSLRLSSGVSSSRWRNFINTNVHRVTIINTTMRSVRSVSVSKIFTWFLPEKHKKRPNQLVSKHL